MQAIRGNRAWDPGFAGLQQEHPRLPPMRPARTMYCTWAAAVALASSVMMACDVDVTGIPAAAEPLGIVRVLDPSSPIVAMALSNQRETLWIEGDKDAVTGRARALRHVVYRTDVGGRDAMLRIAFDDRGLPLSVEDEAGNTLRFTNVDINTGFITATLLDPNGVVLRHPTTLDIGRDAFASLTAAFAAAADHLQDTECDQRDHPNLNLMEFSLDLAEVVLCVAAIHLATPALMSGAITFCASTFVTLFARAIDSDGLRVIGFIVNSVTCAKRGFLWEEACARTIFTIAQQLLSAQCSFIGGTWAGSEYAVVTGSLDVGGVSTPIREVIGPQDGTIVIDQQGCDVHWVVGGIAQRKGDVSGNNINVRGPAAQVVVGTVTNERINHFAALGRICGDLIHFEGDGRFAADIQTPSGSGTIDITIDSDAWLSYRPRRFPGATSSVAGTARIHGSVIQLLVPGLVQDR